MADTNCDGCRKDYDFPRGTEMTVYLRHLPASHVKVICPYCQEEELIFLHYLTILDLAGKAGIEIILLDLPPEDLAERADKMWASYRKSKELPEIPRAWAVEFFDTLREFGGES